MAALGLQLARGRRLARTSWGGFGPGFIWISSPLVSGPLVFFDLTNVPADFGTALSADIEVRTQGVDIADPIYLYAQIFQSDETTPLTEEILCATETADDGWANHPAQFNSIDMIADKAIWDGARVRFRWSSILIDSDFTFEFTDEFA